MIGRKRTRDEIRALQVKRSQVESEKDVQTKTRRRVSEIFYSFEVEHVKVERHEKVDDEEIEEAEITQFIKLKSFPPIMHGNCPYVVVRECYLDLYEKVRKCLDPWYLRTSITITGNPGIGKSYFYLYCIFRLLKEKFFEHFDKNSSFKL